MVVSAWMTPIYLVFETNNVTDGNELGRTST